MTDSPLVQSRQQNEHLVKDTAAEVGLHSSGLAL